MYSIKVHYRDGGQEIAPNRFRTLKDARHAVRLTFRTVRNVKYVQVLKGADYHPFEEAYRGPLRGNGVRPVYFYGHADEGNVYRKRHA